MTAWSAARGNSWSFSRCPQAHSPGRCSGGRSSPFLSLLEQGDGLVDSALASFGGLGGANVVDVVALQTARRSRTVPRPRADLLRTGPRPRHRGHRERSADLHPARPACRRRPQRPAGRTPASAARRAPSPVSRRVCSLQHRRDHRSRRGWPPAAPPRAPEHRQVRAAPWWQWRWPPPSDGSQG